MKRRLILIAVAMMGLAVLLIAAWRMYLAHVINSELTRIRTAGLPTNGEELNRWYASIPDNQNAALVLTQAFALHRNYPDSRSNLISDFKLPARNESLSPQDLALLHGYVELNEDRISLGDEALKLPVSRYPIDLTRLTHTELPHLAELADLARLYQYAAFVEFESGNFLTAKSNILSLLALAHTLDDEPCVISQLVRFKLIGMAYSTLERRANAGPIDTPEIASLTTAFAAVRTTNSSVVAMIGERALFLPYFRMTRAEYAQLNPPKDGEESRTDSPLPCHGPIILRLIGYYDLDHSTFLKGMNRAIQLLGNPPPDNMLASGYLTRIGEESLKHKRTISGTVFSSYARLAEPENQAVAQQRLALVALAVQYFRNENDRLPVSLDELVPKHLPEVPADPFNGRELIYRHSGKGFVAYSVGRDQLDDGGLGESEEEKSNSQKPHDITFTLEQ